MPNHPHNSDPSPPSPSNQPLQLTSDARDNIAPDTNPPYRGRLATERNPFDGDPAHVGASPPARDSAFGGPPGVAADGGVPGTAGGPPPGTAPAPHADCRVARDGAPTASPVPADGPDPHPSLAHVGASPPRPRFRLRRTARRGRPMAGCRGPRADHPPAPLRPPTPTAALLAMVPLPHRRSPPTGPTPTRRWTPTPTAALLAGCPAHWKSPPAWRPSQSVQRKKLLQLLRKLPQPTDPPRHYLHPPRPVRPVQIVLNRTA